MIQQCVTIEGTLYVIHWCPQPSCLLVINKDQQCPTYPELEVSGVERVLLIECQGMFARGGEV